MASSYSLGVIAQYAQDRRIVTPKLHSLPETPSAKFLEPASLRTNPKP